MPQWNRLSFEVQPGDKDTGAKTPRRLRSGVVRTLIDSDS
jgi:hypothetical protein